MKKEELEKTFQERLDWLMGQMEAFRAEFEAAYAGTGEQAHVLFSAWGDDYYSAAVTMHKDGKFHSVLHSHKPFGAWKDDMAYSFEG